MTLLSTQSRVSYAGDGVTQNFAVPFKIWAPSDLSVIARNDATRIETAQTLTADYSVSVEAYPGTGLVQFHAPPAAGHSIVILRDLPPLQELDLMSSGAFAAETIETQLDKMTAQIQTMRETLARTPRLPSTSPLSHLDWPEPRPDAANQLLGISSSGETYELKAAASIPLQTVSSFISTLLDDPDASAARATLGIGASIDLNLLTSDTTGGALADFVAFVDASAGLASKKVPVANFLSTAIAASTSTAPSDASAFEVLSRKLSDGSLHKVRLCEIGTGKQTIWIPAAALIPRLTNGPTLSTIELPTNKLMVRSLDFDPSVPEYAQIWVQMPKGWNHSTLSAVFVWSHGSASGNFNVVWAIRGLSLSDDDAIDTPFSALVQVTDSGGTSNDLYRSPETPSLTLSGSPQEGDVAIFEVFRASTDPADTLSADARLHGLALFFTTQTNTDD